MTSQIGSMWMRVLEAGEFENQRVTISNMLDYIGASEWYERQIRLSQATVRTKRNKLVDRRGAASHVLNRMQGLQTNTEQPGNWIRGVGRLTLGEEEDELALLFRYGSSIVSRCGSSLFAQPSGTSSLLLDMLPLLNWHHNK